ncbi:MAG TPA: sulfite exporter TauE/SafE family protein [Candidatus Kapabacteria bacterium]|nr:sulfite exporter TauE/SafE family protein [Candidatus Kapabacteria bacterium]
MPSYLEIALGSLIAGTLDTVAGFGGVLLLLPILVLAADSRDAVLLSAIIPLGWNIVRIVMVRPWLRVREALLFAAGIIPGAAIGAWLFEGFDPELLRSAIGIVLVIFGSYYVLRLYVEVPQLRMSKAWFPLVGVLSGIVAAVLGGGHGPLQSAALSAAALSPREVAATNGAIGGITALARLGAYAASGSLHSALWLPGMIGAVSGAIGALIGIRIARRGKDSTLELVIGAALVLAGMRMLM